MSAHRIKVHVVWGWRLGAALLKTLELALDN